MARIDQGGRDITEYLTKLLTKKLPGGAGSSSSASVSCSDLSEIGTCIASAKEKFG